MNRQPKAKKCRHCKQEFVPQRPLQVACSPSCAIAMIEVAKAKKTMAAAKESRKKDRERREKLKSRTDYADEAQQAFNAWIRARDWAAGYGCISCGTKNQGIQYAAGHYRTVKAAPHLRYNPDNVHLQCNYNCNSAKGGNVVEYRIALVKRIGLERVEALENNNTLHRYEIDELKAIRDEYRRKLKELQK